MCLEEWVDGAELDDVKPGFVRHPLERLCSSLGDVLIVGKDEGLSVRKSRYLE